MRIPDHVSVIDIDEGAIVLDGRSGTYYQLNWVAAQVLRHLEAGRSTISVSREIAEASKAPFDEVEADVSALMHDLYEQGLVEE